MANKKTMFLGGSIILVLIGIILVAGCSSAASSSKGTAASTTLPVNATQTAEVSFQETTPAVTVATTAVPVKPISLSSEISLSYPEDWEMETPGDFALRDYGRVTTNLANFFSPTTYNGKYTAVSVDIDPETVSDNDHYFNLATVALQKHYGTIEITHHTQQESGVTLISACSICKHYNLEFDTKTLDKWYHFVYVGGTFYIVSINNPDLNHEQVLIFLKSIKITPPSQQKHR